MATAIPEVRALGGGDVVVVAGHPGAAGAGGVRQRANRASDCRQETVIIVVPLTAWAFSTSAYCDWAGWGSPRHWVLMRGWCGRSSIRRWWFGTQLRSQWEEKEQPGRREPTGRTRPLLSQSFVFDHNLHSRIIQSEQD